MNASGSSRTLDVVMNAFLTVLVIVASPAMAQGTTQTDPPEAPVVPEVAPVSAVPSSAETQPAAQAVENATASTRRCWPEVAETSPRIMPGMIVKNVHLDAKRSPKTDFASGESFVEVIQLPEFRKRYAIEFWMSFDVNFKRANEIMIPSAVVVDASFCELRDYGGLNFKYEANFLTGSGHEKARVPIEDANARYVLVYTDARRIGHPVSVSFGLAKMPFVRMPHGYTMVRINK